MKIDSSRLVQALDDPDVARWHANLSERSDLTADIYVRRLDRFCDEFKTSPRCCGSWMFRAVEEHALDPIILRYSPLFEKARHDPRYREALIRNGLDPDVKE